MSTQDDVRRFALGLPETTEDVHSFRFFVDGKAFVWSWLERVDPKKARVPSPDVIAVRVADESDKDALISMDPRVFFTERHYDGYPAVLIRIPDLARLERHELRDTVVDAWLTRAHKRVAGAFTELARTI